MLSKTKLINNIVLFKSIRNISSDVINPKVDVNSPHYAVNKFWINVYIYLYVPIFRKIMLEWYNL